MTGLPVAVVRRVLPAPPHVVFDEWLDPEGMTEAGRLLSGVTFVKTAYDAAADAGDLDWVTLEIKTTSKNEPTIRYTVRLADGDGELTATTPR